MSATLTYRTMQGASTPPPPNVADGDLSRLAPAMRHAVEQVIERMQARGFDPVVFEAMRSDERQKWLYAQGRTRPGAIVTNASSGLKGWHFYGLAVDIISRSKCWDAPFAFWTALGAEARACGLAWGGDWTSPHDPPHCQWGKCAKSPKGAPTIYAKEGLEAVWRAVGAATVPAPKPAPSPEAAPSLRPVEPRIVGLREPLFPMILHPITYRP